jgi:sugar lactone lactonase YvrE
LFALQASCQAQMVYPVSVAASADQIVVADLNLPGIWKVNSKLELLIAGEKKFRQPLNRVRCVALDAAGNVLAGDSATREVFRIEMGKAVPLSQGQIGIPMSIGVRKNGDIIVADLELHRIVKLPATGGDPEKIADVQAPRGLFVAADDTVLIVSGGENALLKLDAENQLSTIVIGRKFQYPSSVVIDADGNTLVCDSYAKSISKVAGDGKIELFSEGSFTHPVAMAVHGAEILVVDSRANALFSLDAKGKATKLDVAQ